MSFVRISRTQGSQGKRPTRSKRVTAAKKEWVSTINDLSVHKATPEELARRHEMHRSQNRAAAQFELREKALQRRSRLDQFPISPGLDRARLNIIREVFSEQLQLQDVLQRSDRAMAVVKDLFGDAPHRHTGFPSITKAPECGSDPELPVLQKPSPPTQLSLLSQSVMDQQALNELENSEREYSDDDRDPALSFTSTSDVCRNKGKSSGGGSGDPAALNATMAVERVKSRQSQEDCEPPTTLASQVLNPDPAPIHTGRKNRPSRARRGRCAESSGLNSSGLSSLTGNQSSLELLQSMLGQVETELDALEFQGPETASQGPQECGRGITGFSMALVSTLGRLASHLRRTEEAVCKEGQERRRLEEEVKEQRSLIDALTAESLTLREESASLRALLQDRMAELEQRLDTVVLAMGGLGGLGLGVHTFGELNSREQRNGAIPTGSEETHSQGERDTGNQDSVSAAVLLSPPRQRDNHLPATGTCARSLQYSNGSCHGSRDSLDAPPVSPSSFASLPQRTSLLLHEASQSSILDQVADLTRQNAAVRTRLGQCRPSPTGGSTSGEQSAGKTPPAGDAERRVTPPTGQEAACVPGSSVSSLEERLQELNRQSVEARNRLLELIEQQRQNTSLRPSPSISPILPPHTGTLSPCRLTPEASVSMAEKGPSPHSRTVSRGSTGQISPQSLDGANRSARGQVDRRREEAWFALSAHVR
ncbi:LOW QUALITY PROTEIN: spindle and centriole-associated protein 1 [Chanos chanos]|uniref:Spindle and centriole-associated protein 1 n=1 Tax=Chanos chanos TaxID=29144 RepID=A0A6J2UUI7_CHACN|nr:LOW QUALITY PROTEIN: spindle and centriole-associated protein 1 [Chanos chanos]